MSRTQRVMTVNVVYEAEDYNVGHTGVYLMSAFMTAFPGLRRANVAIAIRDDQYEVERTVVINKLGEPSEEMKSLMAEEFAPEPPELPEAKTA